MIEKRVNRLVVVDREGRLVGIIIRADLVRAFTRSDVEIAEEIRDDALRRVLWVEPETIRITVRNGEVELDGELETRADAAVLVTSSSDPWVPTSSPSATGRPGCGCSSSPSSLSAGRPPSFHDQPNQEEDLMTTAEDTSTAVGPRAVFSRVLVGIDGSHESPVRPPGRPLRLPRAN